MNEYSELLDKHKQDMASRWEPSELLNGLSDSGKQKMAVLLENQAQWLATNASSLSLTDAGVTELMRLVSVLYKSCVEESTFDVMSFPVSLSRSNEPVIARTIKLTDVFIEGNEALLDNELSNNTIGALSETLHKCFDKQNTYVYIPLMVTPIVHDPYTFVPQRGFMVRMGDGV